MQLIPNVVYYENWTVIDGDHIELSEDRKKFLVERGHELEPKAGGAICQLVIQKLKKLNVNRKLRTAFVKMQVSNILESYENSNAAKRSLGLHRFIEALKHMFALWMDLGDPDFVNVTTTRTWSQLQDHGTSHFCIVDDDRNAVSLTTTANYAFGGGVLSHSTGIVLNNEMGDFSVPTEVSSDKLPPSPSNLIKPNKRPLSSMTPIVVLKCIGSCSDQSLVLFVLHLIPNVVYYECWTVIDGDYIEFSEDRKKFLVERGHELEPKAGGAICQLVIRTLKKPNVKRWPSGCHAYGHSAWLLRYYAYRYCAWKVMHMVIRHASFGTIPFGNVYGRSRIRSFGIVPSVSCLSVGNWV
nr:gamma-glutamyltranspeptidase 1 [Tanacetum cinerariifolium]